MGGGVGCCSGIFAWLCSVVDGGAVLRACSYSLTWMLLAFLSQARHLQGEHFRAKALPRLRIGAGGDGALCVVLLHGGTAEELSAVCGLVSPGESHSYGFPWRTMMATMSLPS